MQKRHTDPLSPSSSFTGPNRQRRYDSQDDHTDYALRGNNILSHAGHLNGFLKSDVNETLPMNHQVSIPSFSSHFRGMLPTQATRMSESLADCIQNGSMNVDRAARLIHGYYEDGKFCQDEYESFLNSTQCRTVRSFTGSVIPPADISPYYSTLLNNLKCDVTLAVSNTTSISVGVVKKQLAAALDIRKCQELKFSKSSIDTSLAIPAVPGFVQTQFKTLLGDWNEPPTMLPYAKITKAVRFLLGKITIEPDEIKQYTFGCSPKKTKYKLLPLEVSRALEEFILQLACLHSPMYSLTVDEAAVSTTFADSFNQLGNSDDNRKKMFGVYKNLRDRLSSDIIVIVQESLSNLRRSICTIDSDGRRYWRRDDQATSNQEDEPMQK